MLLLRFKSAKQIRDIRDFGTDKISAKAAKEMYERALKLEFDYKQYISGMLQYMNTLYEYTIDSLLFFFQPSYLASASSTCAHRSRMPSTRSRTSCFGFPLRMDSTSFFSLFMIT